MSDFWSLMKEIDNFTVTENGGRAYKSTRNSCLDAFSSLGAMRNYFPGDVIERYYNALYENEVTAKRLLFYLRDVRGGLGERSTFRIILRKLAFTQPEFVRKNLDNVLFFGRGDDFLCLLDSPVEKDVFKYCKSVLKEDLASVRKGGDCSLLAKWMPSENTSSKQTRSLAYKMMNGMHYTPREYRKLLAELRSHITIVESKMSQNKWDEIDFSKLPSRAAMIYSDAFFAHEKDRYIEYLKSLSEGKSKINANVLFPVDILHRVITLYYSRSYSYEAGTKREEKFAKEKILTDALWNALPNYFEGKEETGICVVDTSGSMSGTPLEVALSLGIYCADKCKGPFKGKFITFSADPELHEIKGDTIFEKVASSISSHWGMNTNIEKVFDLILDTAIGYNLKQEDIPQKLYIISDMQFDACVLSGDYDDTRAVFRNRDDIRKKYKTDYTVIEQIQEKWNSHGYSMPSIVFWNVRESNCGMYQMSGTDNCCFVSGYSPTLFKAVIEGTTYEEEVKEDGSRVKKQKLDPITIMNNTLYNTRYDRVVIS